MERKVLIEKFKEKLIYTVLVEKYQEKPIYYVYVYLDPRKPGKYIYGDYSFYYEPFYIGKGNGNRSEDHINEAKNILSKGIKINKKNFPNVNLHKINKILRIIKEELIPIILKLDFNMMEQEAFKLEIKCIKAIGRYDLKKGPLTNLTDGGDGTSGRVMSEDAKQKLIDFRTGKKLSPAHIASLIKGVKKRKLKYPNGCSPKQIENRCKTNKGKLNIKSYKVIDPNGIIYYTENGLTLFCEIHNLTQVCMSNIANGKQINHKGWRCELLENGKTKIEPKKPNKLNGNSKLFKVTNPNGEIFYTENGLKEFCKNNNLTYHCMTSLASGKGIQHQGWKCERAYEKMIINPLS